MRSVDVGPGLDLSNRAFDCFVAASKQCPASVTGQAAVIALRCQEFEEDPILFRDILVTDENQISKIAVAATRVHQAKGKTRDAGPMTHFRVAQILIWDFSFAAEMMILDSEYLLEASTNMYRKYIRPQGQREKFVHWLLLRKEANFHNLVQERIDIAKKTGAQERS